MTAATLLLAFLSLFADDVSSPEPYEIAADPGARSVFNALLHRSRYGFAAEEAAFIVRCPNGNLAGIHWPAGAGKDGVEWAGEFPRGVLAIAHTHPGWLTLPSRIDRVTAARTRLPVYVITQSSITKTDGGEPVVVTSGSWSSESRRDKTARSSSSSASAWRSRRE